MGTTEEDYRIVVYRTANERRVHLRNKDQQNKLFRFMEQSLVRENIVLYEYVRVFQMPKMERSCLS